MIYPQVFLLFVIVNEFVLENQNVSLEKNSVFSYHNINYNFVMKDKRINVKLEFNFQHL